MAVNLKTPGVHHVSLRSTNLERSKKFYEGVLGFPVLLSSPEIVVLGAGSTAIALRAPDAKTPPGAVANPFRPRRDHVARAGENERELARAAAPLRQAARAQTGVNLA